MLMKKFQLVGGNEGSLKLKKNLKFKKVVWFEGSGTLKKMLIY